MMWRLRYREFPSKDGDSPFREVRTIHSSENPIPPSSLIVQAHLRLSLLDQVAICNTCSVA
ncbi:unnamed protein product [Haemonchus placei]|uniref:Uncharacterized protein n=1 Tax=Haemonchus placei TaxID=6290 RepID=A0A0N4WZI9_HAEPC|nr:unnamed protein product [Haemonchus placei]